MGLLGLNVHEHGRIACYYLHHCLARFLAIHFTEEAFRQALDVTTSLAKGYIHLDRKLSEELSTLRTDLHDWSKCGNFRVSAQPRDRRAGSHRPRPCEMRDARCEMRNLCDRMLDCKLQTLDQIRSGYDQIRLRPYALAESASNIKPSTGHRIGYIHENILHYTVDPCCVFNARQNMTICGALSFNLRQRPP